MARKQQTTPETPPLAPLMVASRLVMVPIQDIRPYQRNPRKNDATIEKLVELIPKVGFNVPLVLDHDNIIVKGHSRWAAAIRLGMRALPCLYSDADPETIRLDRLADNRVQEFSSWDEAGLQAELAALNLSFDFDLGSLNFDLQPLNGHAAGDFAPPPMTTTTTEGTTTTPGGEPFITPEDVANTVPIQQLDYIEVTCDQCGHKLFVKP